MQNLKAFYKRTDTILSDWMARYGLKFLRVSLGIVYFWFGVLKFFPGLSPAEGLAIETIQALTFGYLPPEVIRILLATWESLIGLGLIFGLWMRATLLLLFVQMLGTLTPIVLFPEQVFVRFPFAPTLEGQYIIKNLVIISSGLVLGATVRGGGLVADPGVLRRIRKPKRKSA